METNETNYDTDMQNTPETRTGSAKNWLIGGALALALGANGYLLVRSNNLSQELAAIRDGNASQFTKVDAAAEASAAENRQRMEKLAQAINDAHSTATSAHTAIKRVQVDEKKQADVLTQKLDEQKSQITGELTTFKDDTSNKFNQFTTEVGGVKTDVDTVKTEVSAQKTSLDQHTADLKRVVGDMGVMSGLIATNGKDLDSLRQLGERNYYEFSVNKNQKPVRIGNVTIGLKKVDAKRNRYSVEVLADDKTVEKKDRTINEPVQIYVSGSRQPSEIVVNQVNKDSITGYLATPKVVMSRR